MRINKHINLLHSDREINTKCYTCTQKRKFKSMYCYEKSRGIIIKKKNLPCGCFIQVSIYLYIHTHTDRSVSWRHCVQQRKQQKVQKAPWHKSSEIMTGDNWWTVSLSWRGHPKVTPISSLHLPLSLSLFLKLSQAPIGQRQQQHSSLQINNVETQEPKATAGAGCSFFY